MRQKDKKESKAMAAEDNGNGSSSNNQFQDPTYQPPLTVPPQEQPAPEQPQYYSQQPQVQPQLTPEPDPLNGPMNGPMLVPNTPAPTLAAGPYSSLIVVIGGNGSCEKQFNRRRPNTIFTSFDKMVNKLGKKYKIYLEDNVIFACYGKNSEEMVYTKGNAPDDSGVVPHQNLASLVMANSTPETSVTIIGFSYGGWRAMKLTNELIDNNYQNQVLITIDPISRNCQRPRDKACREAPQDLASNFGKIKRGTIRWVNFYQNSLLLHSDKISCADFNHHIWFRTHLALDTVPNVWNKISVHFIQLSTHFDQQNYDSWN